MRYSRGQGIGQYKSKGLGDWVLGIREESSRELASFPVPSPQYSKSVHLRVNL
jgi:hypothetical protein